jgi:4-nitrophenyl phosphatase
VNFNDIQAVVCDMDGVLWRGDTPLDGMHDFFNFLHDNALPFMLATNNSGRSPAMYVEKIKRLGVDSVRAENIVTSGNATAAFLQGIYPPGTKVHVMGGPGLHDVIREAGFTLVDKGAEAAVIGLWPEMTYDHMRRAALAIRAGARFVATNPDPTFPTPEGLAPGTGSLVAAVQTATDVVPDVIGKPYAPMFDYVLERLGVPAENTLMIGDRLSTDILGGVNAGMKTALVFTGVNTPDDLVESDVQPTAAFDSIKALVTAWRYEGGKRRR